MAREAPARHPGSSPGQAPNSLDVEVCPLEELAPGSMKLVQAGSVMLGVFNLDGELYAIEDRCSHDDGPLVEGDWEPDEAVVICPRHGSRFDIRTGRALTLPAYLPVETFPVRVEAGIVKVTV
jgi:3-phenylpropionate/trans-cinnamate dioxygenase ferredoxin subunit